MTAQSDPYVRVYYRIIDDPKFAGVYDDDTRLALWLRLLLLADGAYPAPAPVPHAIRRPAFRHLVEVGLIDLEPGDRYRIHGMDAERGARSRRASDAAREKWRRARSAADGDAPALRPHHTGASAVDMHSAPLRSEPLRSEPLRAGERAPDEQPPDDAYDVMLLIERLTHRPFAFRDGSPVHDTLVGDVATHGAARIAAEYRAMHETSAAPLDAAQLVFGVHNALHPLIRPRALSDDERREAEVEAAIRLVRGGAS
jgi:hypothetical protein